MEKVPLMPLPSPEEARKLRTQMGLTLEDAADEIGVSKYTVMRWEHGGKPTPKHHRDYHKALTRWREIISNYQ